MNRRPPPALGIRHVALKVKDLKASESFYAGILGYRVEWRPDADNVYMTLGEDNLALHRDDGPRGPSTLDHFGILVKNPQEVDDWADYLKSRGVALSRKPKTHRDGARSFYVNDPEGNALQFIHHPPMVLRVTGRRADRADGPGARKVRRP